MAKFSDLMSFDDEDHVQEMNLRVQLKSLSKASDCGADTGPDGGFGPGNDCAGEEGSGEKLPRNLDEFHSQLKDSDEWHGMPVVEGGEKWQGHESLDGQKTVSDDIRGMSENMASEMQVEDVRLYTGIGYNNASRYARNEDILYDMPKEHRKPAVNIVQTMDHLTDRPIDVVDRGTFVLHRGMRIELPDSSDYDGKKSWVEKVINAKPGDKFQPKGFLSTSDDFGVAYNFAKSHRSHNKVAVMFSIEAERGLALSQNMTTHKREREVVLPRNGSYTVVAKEVVREVPSEFDEAFRPFIHITMRQDQE